MRLLITLTVAIFVTEILIMFALGVARLDNPLAEAGIDAFALTAFLFPVLYLGVFKAIAVKNDALTTSERNLLAGRDELERRIDERTADLAAVNMTLERSIRISDAQRRSAVLLGETVRLLQACQNSGEAYNIIAKQFQGLLPDTAGALYVFKSSRNLLERAVDWNSSTEFSAASFQPEECWALRMGRLHQATTDGKSVRCQHFAANASPTVCVPVVASGEVLGSLSFCLGRKPVEERTTAVGDEVRQYNDNSDEVEQQEIEYLSIMGESVAIALANIRLREALRDQAVHDKLTGLFNRRFMDEVLDLELSRVERDKASLAVVMMDVDHFKKFNDRHGHDAGDMVLAALGGCLLRQTRKSDICCRYGGEELLVVLPDTDAAAAASWADTLRQAIENMILSHQGQQLGPVTVSCGVASYPLNANNKAELVKAADEALYRSKADGRNRVTVTARSAHPLP